MIRTVEVRQGADAADPAKVARRHVEDEGLIVTGVKRLPQRAPSGAPLFAVTARQA